MKEALFLACLFMGSMLIGHGAHALYFEPLMKGVAANLLLIGVGCWIMGVALYTQLKGK